MNLRIYVKGEWISDHHINIFGFRYSQRADDIKREIKKHCVPADVEDHHGLYKITNVKAILDLLEGKMGMENWGEFSSNLIYYGDDLRLSL